MVINEILEKNFADASFTSSKLASEMYVSPRQMNRQIKSLTGKSPWQYVLEYRLEKAMQFLNEGTFVTVKETAYSVGFAKVSYFIQRFQDRYKKTPYEILKEKGWR